MEDNYLPKYSKLKKKELISEIEKLHAKISILVNYPKSTKAYFIRMDAHYEHDELGLMWGIDPNKLVDTDKANGNNLEPIDPSLGEYRISEGTHNKNINFPY
jgi:hypothetical protein